ncbi:MAG: protein translocase subunit SecF, partial [Candidatus Sericytochromatia bacterium]
MAAKSSGKHAGTTEVLDSEAVEETVGSAAPRHGFFIRLYTGTGAFDVVGRRKLWFAVSGVIIAIAIAAMLIRGFNFGIDFEGGTKVSFPRGDATVQQVEDVFRQTLGSEPEQVVVVGNGASA